MGSALVGTAEQFLSAEPVCTPSSSGCFICPPYWPALGTVCYRRGVIGVGVAFYTVTV